MKSVQKALSCAAAVLLSAAALSAQAQVRITEVAPWGSGDAPYGTDWFELTNIGTSALSLTGWKMDDNSNSFAAAVALTGITSIAAGESVIFLETPSAKASFLSTWFGANAPAGLQIGGYTGSGVGLSTGGDAVNIYNSTGVLQANVSFGAADATSPFQTFDNAAKLNNTTISLLSAVGVNGGFKALNDNEFGSPGSIAPVPEPATYALMLAGLGLIGAVARKRRA